MGARYEAAERWAQWLSGAALVAGLVHCGADSATGGEGSAGPSGGGYGGGLSDAGAGAYGGSGGGTSADAGLPPEKEIESSFRSPVATGRYVWSANPDSGRVALVDAFTLEVRTVDAGFGPTYLAAVPGGGEDVPDQAVVLNVLSDDATVLRARPGSIDTISLPTHETANAWAVSADGHWAVAWTDARQFENPDPTDGFQDVTVLDLSEGAESATRLSVGYRPVAIAFDEAGTRAFAVTEPGISVLALDAPGPRIAGLVEVTDDPLDNPASRDVTITPDGSYALVRRDGSPDVGFVDLETAERVTVTLNGNVTDLDLSEDGSRAVAVVRSLSEVVVMPVPGIALDPTDYDVRAVPDEIFGSVSLSENANVALLYTTTEAATNTHVTVMSTAIGLDYLSAHTVDLKAPVAGVFATPDALHAIALLEPGDRSSKAGAFSVVPTAPLRAPKIVGTDAAPIAVAIEPAPTDRALVTISNDTRGPYGVYLVRLPTMQVDLIDLPSPPIATGIVPGARRGFVAQAHPEGRITFVNLDDGTARTLTGFELAAQVVD